MRKSLLGLMSLLFLVMLALPLMAQDVYPTPGAPTTLPTGNLDALIKFMPQVHDPCKNIDDGSCNFGEGVKIDVPVVLNAGEGTTCSGDDLEATDEKGNPLVSFPTNVIDTSLTVYGVFSDVDGYKFTLHVKSGAFCSRLKHVLVGSAWTAHERSWEMQLRLQQYLMNGDATDRYVEQATAYPNCETIKDVLANGPSGVDCPMSRYIENHINLDGFNETALGFYGENGVPRLQTSVDGQAMAAMDELYYINLNPTATATPPG